MKDTQLIYKLNTTFKKQLSHTLIICSPFLSKFSKAVSKQNSVSNAKQVIKHDRYHTFYSYWLQSCYQAYEDIIITINNSQKAIIEHCQAVIKH